jgi:ubiquitin-protein ligase
MSVDIDNNIREIRTLIAKSTNGKTIRLIKYNENVSDVTMHMDIDSLPIKVTTDFDKYCLAETVLDTINLNGFNLQMIFNKKYPKNILEELAKIDIIEQAVVTKSKFIDPFHIYQKLDEFTKCEINWNKLEKEFKKLIDSTKFNGGSEKIPRELLLSPTQISQLIMNEVKQVNRNKLFDHYIIPNQSNPYSLNIRFKFNKDTEAGKIFEQINRDFGYDYMEIKLNLEQKTHPFIPPKLEYIRPKIKLPLLLSLMNLDILKLENWSATVTLDYLISNLGSQIENVIKNYIIPDAPSNANPTISFNDLEYQLIKLASITKEKGSEEINIQITVPKGSLTESNSKNKFWKSGTGYGGDGQKEWDIKTYIKEQELHQFELIKCLKEINGMINDSNYEMINDSVLLIYMINQIKGLNLLDMEKNRSLYSQIFNILANLIGKPINQKIINDICSGLKSLHDEIDVLFKNSKESLNDEFLLQTYCMSEWYVDKYQEPVHQIVVSADIKEQYCQVMKKLQFGSYEIPSAHRYIKNKGQKPDQKALMRILSEISSFKTGLPLNWESTIWVRVPKENFNLFSFLISGPKDTPYENGLFEFHAYLPSDYPNSIPQVLIHTTGNGKVRFNPNLYDSGKVCLSLLGTWRGQEGESWNPKTSTFLQVMVSIQSLILVEQPYFNEPGYESNINTAKGKQMSDFYSEERQPHTIRLAMTDMITNPPAGFEEVVRNHFRMKKDEIINRTLIWEQNATKHGALIKANRQDLIKALEKL